jgi:hypothetical protein
MDNKRVAAFCLLAHINDNDSGIKNFNEIFIPIVKSALCKLNGLGIKSGQSIMEIKVKVDEVFALDIPIPILRDILNSISTNIAEDSSNEFFLHKDGSFQMNKFLFEDFEEELVEQEEDVKEIEKIYLTYLNSIGVDPSKEASIFEYIDSNRSNLSKFFAQKDIAESNKDYLHQANFVNSIKGNRSVYNILKRIYLGSIIAAYLEVEIGEASKKLDLLLDTNFILGLLDLNSIESAHTCRKISEICDRLGYTKSILPFTIEETEMLIERKAESIENAFFQGALDPESIYNAAKRRNLSKTQLLQIVNNLQQKLQNDFAIRIIGNDEKYRSLAKYQYAEIFNFYKKLRHDNAYSALHDTTAIAYVKEKRGKQIKGDFMKANCWFVTNTPFQLALPQSNGYLPEIIRAEDILNFLWLSNPNVTGFIGSSELTSMGLTRLVSSTISYSLPSTKVLKDLDDNFNAFGGKEITADDTIMVSSMIARKRIKRPEDLNRLASEKPEDFIKKVKEFANEGRKEEKEISDKLDKILLKINLSEKKAELNEVENIAKVEEDKDNVKLIKVLLILVSFIFLSFIWWSIDILLDIKLITENRNYYIIKSIGQVFIVALSMILINKSNRNAWIGVSGAFFLSILGFLKYDGTSQKNERHDKKQTKKESVVKTKK